MTQDKRFTSGRIFYASPWIFASAAGLLALIIAVFAVNNFQREKKLMQNGLIQEGRAVLGLVSSASRDSLRRAIMRGEVEPANMLETVQLAIETGAEHPNLASLYLTNQAGMVLAHSNNDMVGKDITPQSMVLLGELEQNKLPDVSRVVQAYTGDKDVFMIMAPFYLIGSRFPTSHDASQMRRRMMGRNMFDRLDPSERQHLLEELERLDLFLVAELELRDFAAIVRKQLVQVGIMSITLLLVGAGGILSLMMLQGLRISQSRLARMATCTDVLVSSLPIGLIAIGRDDIIRTCNTSVQEMLGLDVSEPEGKPASVVLPENLYSILNQGDSDKSLSQFEMSSSDLPGNGRSLFVTTVAIEGNEDKERGTMLLIQDLSQVKKLEADLRRVEKDAAVGRMAAGVAHELRNPLSSIKGLALLLKSKTGQGGTEREAARLLTDEVDRLNRSISELLDYARPTRLSTEQVTLDGLVRKAVTLVRADAEGANIEITEHYNLADKTVSVDRDKITQVILNLCLNAIQAIPAGGEISVETRIEELGVEIEVNDSGPGLDSDKLEKVFEPYYTTKSNGTGLGLAMSRKIVEDHGGTISLYSQEGGGTRAVILLPFSPVGVEQSDLDPVDYEARQFPDLA